MKRRTAGRSAWKKVLNNEETRRVHPWVPQGHSAIAASLGRAVPPACGRKEMEKKGRKEERKTAFKQTNQKQRTTKPCPLDSFMFIEMNRLDMVKHAELLIKGAQPSEKFNFLNAKLLKFPALGA